MKIERLAREAGVLTFVGVQLPMGSTGPVRAAADRGGEAEQTHPLSGRFFVGYGSNPQGVLSWRFQREFAGLGALGDLMSHVVDMSLMLAGPIKRVVGNRETFFRRRPFGHARSRYSFHRWSGRPGGGCNERGLRWLFSAFC